MAGSRVQRLANKRTALVALFLGLSALLLLARFVPSLRDALLGFVGYGVGPVAFFAVITLLLLIYRPSLLMRGFKYWLALALLIAATLGALSLRHAEEGILKDASFGGRLGEAFGGQPAALGMFKVLGLLLLIPIVLRPVGALSLYSRLVRVLAIAVIRLADASYRALTAALVYFFVAIKTWSGRPESQEKEETPETRQGAAKQRDEKKKKKAKRGDKEESEEEEEERETLDNAGWRLPPLDLLGKPANHHMPQSQLQDLAKQIEKTLAEHSVDVTVDSIRTGPRVIRFGLTPGWVKRYRDLPGKRNGWLPAEMVRVKVQSILAREKDLALALKTPNIRLEAPVPGEAVVGIEVPNPQHRRVSLREVAESDPFLSIAAKGGLPIALGEATGGDPIVIDLRELPHLLIAGATGSGKSVCINAVVTSLLLTCYPQKLRMIMVDPKRVELTPFNRIPHLLLPVIVETPQVVQVLQGLLHEMFRRYRLMEEQGVRNIDTFNKKTRSPMPYLVFIIDELADLMMAGSYEAEQGVVRIAQLGRATGIHLVLATQRPSVDVVTGLLKANIPTRIAFAVASQVDSRVILDGVGAEKLLSKGDMLFLSHDSPAPQRIQGTYVSDKEIERLVEFWIGQKGGPLPEIDLTAPVSEAGAGEAGSDEVSDELLERAREIAVQHKRISASVLQRRLGIGYTRALRLMELLEEEGSVELRESDKSHEAIESR